MPGWCSWANSQVTSRTSGATPSSGLRGRCCGAAWTSSAHFSFTPQGKRRLHKTPSLHDLVACKPWLDAELETLDPQVVVCLGATATRSVLGPGHSVTKERGQVLRAAEGPAFVITTHPSAVLRAAERKPAYAKLKEDLEAALGALAP